MIDRAVHTDRRLADCPIAIVGMAGLFPQAHTHRDYWQNVLDAVDCMQDVPADRWSLQDYHDPDPATPDKTYSRRGAFVPDVEFNPLEFGLPPNQLEVTSTLQTLSLGVARDLLQDAGAPGSDWYDPQRTGVVLGVTGPVPLMHPLAARLSTPVLREVVRSCGLTEQDADAIADKYVRAFAPWEENSFPGLLANVVAGRVANRFGLGGMNCTVDAACAASLSALRMAIAELVDGRADMMITGGCDTENSIFIYLCFSKTQALSRSGRIRPFDAAADGTLLGEGIGMLALKRLADAQRDGDRIYAVLKGVGSSSDGRANSIYAPRAEGQMLALRRAYVDADCSPGSVELFEAHATGTAVGDRTELTALGQVLTEACDEPGFAALGSVKSQIGHTKGAAGTASVMKLALALYHKTLPPTIGVEQPNSAIDPAHAPFYVNTKTRPWIRDPRRSRRRGAASAMGFGGTNFHVVLEESDAPRTAVRTLHRTARVQLWHGPDVAHLVTQLQAGQPGEPAGPVPAGDARVGFVSTSDADAEALRALAVEQLGNNPDAAGWDHPRGVHFRRCALPGLTVGAVFAGQGTQYLDMGLEAALNNPLVGAAFDEANAEFADTEVRLSAVVYPPPVFDSALRQQQEAALRRTEYAQPAIGALSAGQFRFLTELGLRCEVFLGHSFGELTALWAAGSLTDADFFRLARARGTAMAGQQTGADPGAMAAIEAGAEQVEELLSRFPDVQICNYNAPDQVVIGGATPAVQQVVEACREQDVTARTLPVSAAFHTAHVAHAVDTFGAAVDHTELRPPTGVVIANSPAAGYGADLASNRRTLTEQLRRPVDFVAGLRSMAGAGCTVIVEFGPKQVLTGLVRRTLGPDVIAIPTDAGPLGDSDVALKQAALRLAVLGVPISDVGRYDAARPQQVEPAGMTITLNAAEYVPPERTAAYRAGLDNGYRIAAATRNGDSNGSRPVHTEPPAFPASPPAPVPAAVPAAVPAVAAADRPDSGAPEPAGAVPDVLAQHAEVHTRYLNNQLDVAGALVAAMRAQHGNGDTGGLAAVAEAVAAQSATIGQTHTRANEVLAALAELEFQPGAGTPLPAVGSAPPAAAVAPAPPVPAPSPAQPPPDSRPAPIAAEPAVAEPAEPAAAEPVGVESVGVGLSGGAGVDPVVLRAALVEVVAEKTGYPAEMVDPGLDLEADLGVDSIKRVQVMGAVQQRFPQLPVVGPESLAVLRTVEQVVAHFVEALGSAAVSGTAPQRNPVPAVPEPAAAESVGVGVPGGAGVDPVVLRAALVEVVAEKTGYPAEMVDPGLDLEADLGVDSIKRVQVMGAVQQRFPQLPVVGPESLAVLRTVEQVVAHFVEALGSPAERPAVDTPAAARTTPVTALRHRIGLASLPAVDLADPFPPDPVALLIDVTAPDGVDPGLPTGPLAEELSRRGWRVHRVSLPATGGAGWLDEPAWDGTARDTDLRQGCRDVLDQHGRLDACLLMLPTGPDAATGARRLGDAILAAKHAGPALAETARGGTRAAFLTLTRLDGGLGLTGRCSSAEAVLGGVGGVVKTLGQESPELFCRSIDVDPALGVEATVGAVLAELHDAARDVTEVGYGATAARWTPRLTAQPVIATDEPELGADDVIVVTGGARGITAMCVQALADQVPAEFILLGRTVLGEEPEWLAGVPDDELRAAVIDALSGGSPPPSPRDVQRMHRELFAQREVRRTLGALSAAGATVRYLAVDVNDQQAVHQVLAPDRDRVTAVVHGAGTLADALLPAKTPEQIRSVLTPKLAGLHTVLSALQGAPLRQVVLFSSVAGVFGNAGQADYAAANEALSRWAAGYAGAGRATALAWAAWDGGMVTPQLRELFQARGVPLLDPATGTRLFVEELCSGAQEPGVLLGPAVPLTAVPPLAGSGSVTAHRDIGELADHPVLGAHRIGSAAVLPATVALGWMVRVAESVCPGRQVVEARQFEVLKGVVFDATLATGYRVRIDDGGPDPAARAVVHATVYSDPRGSARPDAPVAHYRATLLLADAAMNATDAATAPVRSDWPRDRLGQGLEDAAQLYTTATQFHGPALHGMRRILEWTDQRLVVECRLADTDLGRGGYQGARYRPVLTDVVLQVPPVQGHRLLGAACLPLGMGAVELFAPLPDDDPFVVIVDDPRPDSGGLTVTATACAPDGRVLVRMSDVLVVSTPDLDGKFTEAVAAWQVQA